MLMLAFTLQMPTCGINAILSLVSASYYSTVPSGASLFSTNIFPQQPHWPRVQAS